LRHRKGVQVDEKKKGNRHALDNQKKRANNIGKRHDACFFVEKKGYPAWEKTTERECDGNSREGGGSTGVQEGEGSGN